MRVGLEGFAAQVAHDHVLVGDHDAQTVCGLNVTDALAEAARCDVAVGDGADARLTRQLAFGAQAAGEPVGFTREVAADVRVAEGFEPPRGSGAQVSIDGLAVDDRRAAFVVPDSVGR
jgi:hypothetical protein